MTTREVDVLIIGGGIAGITLAWQLRLAGLSFAIVHDNAPGASYAAAGLMTPVTGSALRVEPNYARLLQDAVMHYRRVESESGTAILSAQTIRRTLEKPKELRCWKAHSALGIGYTSQAASSHDRRIDILLRCGYRLDVDQYLIASSKRFLSAGIQIEDRIDDDELLYDNDAVHVPRLALRASVVVMCRGAAERHYAAFSPLQWRCAKGEVLRVRCDSSMPNVRLHANGIWLCPIGNDVALLGATYSWDELDSNTTDSARDTLLEKARESFDIQCTVLDQRAGVRPIVSGRKPVAGAHPENSRLMIFNGLGSKGALYAPHIARLLTHQLRRLQRMPTEFSLSHRSAAQR